MSPNNLCSIVFLLINFRKFSKFGVLCPVVFCEKLLRISQKVSKIFKLLKIKETFFCKKLVQNHYSDLNLAKFSLKTPKNSQFFRKNFNFSDIDFFQFTVHHYRSLLLRNLLRVCFHLEFEFDSQTQFSLSNYCFSKLKFRPFYWHFRGTSYTTCLIAILLKNGPYHDFFVFKLTKLQNASESSISVHIYVYPPCKKWRTENRG